MEKHTGADLANLMRQYWDSTHDAKIKENIKELATGICDFYVSIAIKSDDGKYSIDKVVPPDEFATGWRY